MSKILPFMHEQLLLEFLSCTGNSDLSGQISVREEKIFDQGLIR
jgi:hypothetical protein